MTPGETTGIIILKRLLNDHTNTMLAQMRAMTALGSSTMESVGLPTLILTVIFTCLSSVFAEGQGPIWHSVKDPFKDKLEVGKTLEFRPRNLPKGAPTDHDCIKGNYYHRVGFSGHEVWLCCVAIEELARDSFQCADESIASLFADTLYMKVQFCSLLHPTSSEPRLIPICVPAPIVAPIDR
jgi:hypothetical protein